MRQLSAFHVDVSCAQPGALDCNRFGELVLDIFGEEVLVTRAKEIMGVVDKVAILVGTNGDICQTSRHSMCALLIGE